MSEIHRSEIHSFFQPGPVLRWNSPKRNNWQYRLNLSGKASQFYSSFYSLLIGNVLQRLRLTKVASREAISFPVQRIFLVEINVGNYLSKKPFLITVVTCSADTAE